MEILVIEDDDKLARSIQSGLQAEGYATTVATSGEEGFFLASHKAFDIILLDILLPGRDGLEILSVLRQHRVDTPVLVLTAKDAIEDRVQGLNSGADDYLIKPFAFEELLARVKALLRRRSPPDVPREVLCFEDLELDTATRQARRGKRGIELSTTEYELLAVFLRNPRIVLTRTLLMDRIWGSDFEGGPNVLEVYIGHLRSKLEQHGEKRLIQTVRGAGYVLRGQ